MKVKPVTYSRKPKYPDKYSIDIRQELLHYRPRRWSNKPLAGGVLAAVIALGFSSCTTAMGTQTAPLKTPNKTELQNTFLNTVKEYEEDDYITMGEPMYIPDFSNIPVFSHGEGTGVIGCVSVAAPMFLTEEEAYAIISSELEKEGISTTKNEKDTLTSANIPVTKTYYGPDDKETIETKSGELVYDASTSIYYQNINIEFVSLDDYREWQDPNQEVWTSVESLNIKGAAEVLAKKNESTAAFYDPFVMYKPVFKDDKEVKENFDKAHEESVEMLKAQVKDFIAWLKAEGVI